MSVFLLLVFFVSIPAFIVFWWKKRKARIAAGENYQNDPAYQSMSKIKRIIGIVCIASLVISIATKPEPTPEEKAQMEIARQERADKEAAEKAEKEKLKAQQEAEAAAKKAQEEQEAAAKKAQQEAEAAEKARIEAEQKAQSERDKMIKEIQTGWNTETLYTDNNNDNWYKASKIVANHTDYIEKAEPVYPDPAVMIKKPWEYYGKVVCITGVTGAVTQEPPGHSVSKLFGGHYFHTVLQGDSPVSVQIKGSADGIGEGQQITVKGFVYGLEKLTNSFGGSPTGLSFTGIVIR